MHSLLWKDSMSVGIPQMDADHQEIAALIGRLHDVLAAGDATAARPVAARLTGAAQAHFAREDDMLRRHDYPLLARHLHAHDTALRRLRALEKAIARGPDTAPALAMLEELGGFFLHRLFVMDMDYKWFLRDHGIAA